MRAPAGDTTEAQLFDYLSSQMRAQLLTRQKTAGQYQKSWAQLEKQSRQYSLDIVPRLAFCRGPFTDLIVDSGLHRYAEFISVQGSYLFVEGALQRVPCSKGEVFKDKFIGMKEKRVLMKFMQTVLSYEPPTEATTALALGNSASGALHTEESEVRRQHAAGVRRPEAATATASAAASAAAEDLSDWLQRPFHEFLL